MNNKKYHELDIWCMVGSYNRIHGTKYWDFKELSEDTGISLEDFLWEME